MSFSEVLSKVLRNTLNKLEKRYARLSQATASEKPESRMVAGFATSNYVKFSEAKIRPTLIGKDEVGSSNLPSSSNI